MYSTLLGGSGHQDVAHGIAVDATGGAVVVGVTNSPDFPLTPGALKSTFGDESEAFLTRFDPSGTMLTSTLLGPAAVSENGGGGEARDVAIGPTGDIYVTGRTWDKNFPMTPGAYGRFDTEWRYRHTESFVMRLTPQANAIVYSTSLLTPRAGGPDWDDEHNEPGDVRSLAIAVDRLGWAHVAGETGAGANYFANWYGAYRSS